MNQLTEFEARELRAFNRYRAEQGLPPLRTEKQVCPGCRGEGTRTVEAIRTHAYTQADIDEMGHDEFDEFMHDMRAGVYDEICDVCAGLRVVDSVNPDSGSDLMLEFLDWLTDASESRAIEAAERRMGA